MLASIADSAFWANGFPASFCGYAILLPRFRRAKRRGQRRGGRARVGGGADGADTEDPEMTPHAFKGMTQEFTIE